IAQAETDGVTWGDINDAFLNALFKNFINQSQTGTADPEPLAGSVSSARAHIANLKNSLEQATILKEGTGAGNMKKRILEFFDTPDPVSDPWTEKLTDHNLDVAAKAAVALEKFIEKRQLDGDAKAVEEVRQWCAVAHVLHDLRRARIGLMGHVLEAMYDMQVDPTAICRSFGCHVALCEPDEILPFYRNPDPAQVEAMKKRILGFFDTPDPVSDPWTEKLTARDLDVAAKAAVALEKFIEKRDLDGFAYYYEGEADSLTRELVTNFIVGNSLLTAAGFPMCGEFDLKNCVAMMIFDRLDIGGSFAEFHPIDFERDTVLVGHDGPHHLNIAAKKPALRSLKKYHGKPGSGAGVEFNIKEGPITMMSIGLKADGTFKFVVAEGESLAGPIPPTGNTNTHGRFPPDVRTFLRRWSMEGPTHHFALGIGHHAAELKKLGRALGVETVVVTEGK
ncbi:MAG: hypothetical protein II391_00165, partial [Kiritimatiellae bacterium]|nr:hypothetical protein [Kiritimatiellia bacterium]